ncbi:SDR family oxidoreductase [Candidatus Pelagibacter sp.]|nr:SDR family oxidoreductase [Candidatus Pelagibacter sp.]
MKIIITGSEGFIGIHLSKFLESKGIKVIKYDLKNKKKKIFNIKNLEKLDGIVHLAGVSRVSESLEKPLKTMSNNALLTCKILESLKNLKKKPWFIFTSTHQIEMEKSSQVKSPYSISKNACDELIKFYASRFNIPSYILKLSDVYSNDNLNNKRALDKMIKKFKDNKSFIIENKSHFFKFIEINELIKIIFQIIKKKKKPICTSIKINVKNKISLTDLAKLVKKKMNSKSKIVFKKKKDKDNFYKIKVIEKSLNVFFNFSKINNN